MMYNKTTPVIEGKTYGIAANNKYNVYDGVIKGGTYHVGKTSNTGNTPTITDDVNETKINEFEEDSEKLLGDEDISGVTYKTFTYNLDSTNRIKILFDANGGTLIATNGVGIYFPQRDSLAVINGGTISGPTGFEIRASKLIVNDGVILGTYDTFEMTPNASGTTTKGAAIAISQHNTKLPIEVIINGGNLKAPAPLTEVNPMNNPTSATDLISIVITQGNFESNGNESIETADDIPILSFITGGTYTTDPTKYVKDGYVVIKIDDNKYKVIDPNSLIINPINNETQQNSQSSTNNSVENNAENINNEVAKEKQTSNPKTEDNIIFFVGLFDVSIVSLAFLLYKNRRKLIK